MAETDKILFTHPHVEAFPVGSVFFTAINNNPSELLGYGTWELIGKGRTILGATSSDEGEETGGSMSKSIALTNLPSHTHSIPGHTHSIPSHTHQVPAHNHTASSSSAGSHNHSASSASAGSHNHAFNMGDNRGNSGTGIVAWESGDVNERRLIEYNKFFPSTKAIQSAGNHAHGITVNNGGAHSHTITVNNKAAFNTGAYSGTSGSGGSGTTGAQGKGTALDITPSYIKLFIWKRIE